MNNVRTLQFLKHVTPDTGYNNNVPYDIYYGYKCNLKIQEDMYSKYSTGFYKYFPKCGTYMVDGVQPIDNGVIKYEQKL